MRGSGVRLDRIRLDVGYDGTGFAGWAAQPGQRTVAGVLAEALVRLFGAAERLTVAGRTDAGVHATGQVCHVDLPAERWAGQSGTAVRRLASVLPHDVRVYAATAVPDSFDARFSAISRRYEYRVADAPWGAQPLAARYTLAWPRPLDLAALRAASAGLVGQHDFAAYCRRKDFGTTIRVLTSLTWHRAADGVLVATVEADAFCHGMVRSLVGALLTVGDGRRPVAWPAQLLGLGERSSDVTVAAAHGLTLVAVRYPDDPAEYEARAAKTRNMRIAG